MKIDIPELMKHRALLSGEIGQTWLDNVAELVETTERSWHLKIGKQLSGGTEALVFDCSTAHGPAVLKLGIPGSLGRETEVLRIAAGRGYAELLDYDAARDAIRIERLGEQLAEAPLSVNQKIEVLCGTLKIAWRRIGVENGLIDAHIWNTLESGNSPTDYKFVDPDGLFAEPAVDLAISLREWREELLEGDTLVLGQQRCELLSNLTATASDAIWQWGFIEHVSCGLLDLHLQDTRKAAQHFTIASRWLSG